MKEILLLTLFFGTIVVSQAQKLDTVYFDLNWKTSDKNNFTYYRLSELKNGLYFVKDYYKNNSIQMKGVFKSITPEIKHGHFNWYYPNGRISRKSFFQDDLLKSTKLWDADGLNLKNGLTADIYLVGTYTEPYTEPQFPGGDVELNKFIKINQKESKQLIGQNINGTVVLNFKISAKGKINSIKVKKSLNPILDNEAVRVLKIMPNWFPGSKNGVKFQKQMTQMFSF